MMSKLGPKLSETDGYFILLVPGQDERIISRDELSKYLTELIFFSESLDALQEPVREAELLIHTACEYKTSDGSLVQWYAVRLSK